MSNINTVIIIRNLLIFLIMGIISISCSHGEVYSGVFQLRGGECSSLFVKLQKVKGFADKYYIVTVYKDTYKDSQGTEFLGVIDDNIITLKSGTVIIHDDSIEIMAGTKKCLYQRIR